MSTTSENEACLAYGFPVTETQLREALLHHFTTNLELHSWELYTPEELLEDVSAVEIFSERGKYPELPEVDLVPLLHSVDDVVYIASALTPSQDETLQDVHIKEFEAPTQADLERLWDLCDLLQLERTPTMKIYLGSSV